jgi:hypothetical protein
MIKQLPAERPLAQKQEILDRVLADNSRWAGRKTWLIPVAAAASIAVVAGGVLAIPHLTGRHDQGVAGQSQTGAVERTDGMHAGTGESIDAGRLTPAQASEFAKACVKWIGATDPHHVSTFPDLPPSNWPDGHAKVDAILHPTLVRSGWDSKATDKTVVVKSGGKTYGCVGQLTKKLPDGRSMFGYDFSTFVHGKHGIYGTAGGLRGSYITLDNKPDKLVTDRWIEVGPEAATVRQRLILKGKASPWFTTKVVDGLAYIRAWNQAILAVGDKGRLETQVLDQKGQLLDVPGTNSKTKVQTGTVIPHPADHKAGELLFTL